MRVPASSAGGDAVWRASYSPAVRLRGLVVALVVAAATVVLASEALAARAPTHVETATILLAFNEPGRSFAARCVRIRVSTASPSWAMVTSPRRPPRACVEAGEVGNGFVILRRQGANRWRNVFEGSEAPPCRVPRAVRVDLFGTARCQ